MNLVNDEQNMALIPQARASDRPEHPEEHRWVRRLKALGELPGWVGRLLKKSGAFVAGLLLIGTFVAPLFVFAIGWPLWSALDDGPAIERVVKGQNFWPVVSSRGGEPLGPDFHGAQSLDGFSGTGSYVPADSLPACAVEYAKSLEGFSPTGIELGTVPAWFDERGGSTMTMQAARRIYEATKAEKSLFALAADSAALREVGRDSISVYREADWTQRRRKILETVLAHKISRTLTDRERVSLYFNVSNFLPKRRGIAYASGRLFGRAPSDLRCREALQLITLLPDPSLHLPKNRAEFLTKYHKKLDEIYSEGRVSGEQYEAWKNPPPFGRKVKSQGDGRNLGVRDESGVSYELYDPEDREPYVAPAGRAVREARFLLKDTSLTVGQVDIVTSIDAEQQKVADSVMTQEVCARFDCHTGSHAAKGIVTLLDANGFYRVYTVTSANEQGDLDYVVENASPGSIIKILIYSLLMAHLREEGLNKEQIFNFGIPTRYTLVKENGQTEERGERCEGNYGDEVTLETAVLRSCNGSAFFAANEILGHERTYDFLQQFGIELTDGAHRGLPGGNFDLSPEKTAALLNGLLTTQTASVPRLVERFVTHDGTMVEAPDRIDGMPKVPRFDPDVALWMRELLRRNVEGGPAERAVTRNSEEANNRPRGTATPAEATGVGEKTGTNSHTRYRYRAIGGQDGQQRGAILLVQVQGEIPQHTTSGRTAAPYSGKIIHGWRALDQRPLMSPRPVP
jgi:membrane peptidoglycan carboxypeptidase